MEGLEAVQGGHAAPASKRVYADVQHEQSPETAIMQLRGEARKSLLGQAADRLHRTVSY